MAQMQVEAQIPPQPAATRVPGVMNWEESINYFVGKGKIQRAAIFEHGGKMLAGTPDMQLSDQDIRAIVHCVGLPLNVFHKFRFGLFIGQVRYVCFKVDDRTMLGVSRDDLFVAHICDNVLILSFVELNKPETDVSCLGEVWTFAQELKSNMDVSQLVQWIGHVQYVYLRTEQKDQEALYLHNCILYRPLYNIENRMLVFLYMLL